MTHQFHTYLIYQTFIIAFTGIMELSLNSKYKHSIMHSMSIPKLTIDMLQLGGMLLQSPTKSI